MDRMKGKIALITGAGTGVGRACMKLFAAEGAKVVGVSRTQGNLDETLAQVQAAGGEGKVVAADLSRPDGAEKAVAETLKAYGRIDILVNSRRRRLQLDGEEPGFDGRRRRHDAGEMARGDGDQSQLALSTCAGSSFRR